MCNDCEHEFVGMDMCIYCHECKQLLLQTRFTHDGKPAKGLKKFQSTSPEPCSECNEKFKKEGIVPLIEAHSDEHSGQPVFGNRYIFIKRAAITGQNFIDFMDKNGFLICDHETMDKFVNDLNTMKENTND